MGMCPITVRIASALTVIGVVSWGVGAVTVAACGAGDAGSRVLFGLGALASAACVYVIVRMLTGAMWAYYVVLVLGAPTVVTPILLLVAYHEYSDYAARMQMQRDRARWWGA